MYLLPWINSCCIDKQFYIFWIWKNVLNKSVLTYNNVFGYISSTDWACVRLGCLGHLVCLFIHQFLFYAHCLLLWRYALQGWERAFVGIIFIVYGRMTHCFCNTNSQIGINKVERRIYSLCCSILYVKNQKMCRCERNFLTLGQIIYKIVELWAPLSHLQNIFTTVFQLSSISFWPSLFFSRNFLKANTASVVLDHPNLLHILPSLFLCLANLHRSFSPVI